MEETSKDELFLREALNQQKYDKSQSSQLYRESSLYRFFKRHLHKVIKDRKKSLNNSGLLLINIAFLLKDSNQDRNAQLAHIEDLFFLTGLDLLCSEDPKSSKLAVRNFTDELGLTQSKQREKLDPETLFKLVEMAREQHPKKNLEELYEITGNVTEISKSQVKKKYHFFKPIHKEACDTTLYLIDLQSDEPLSDYCKYLQSKYADPKYDELYEFNSDKEFILDMNKAWDDVVNSSYTYVVNDCDKSNASALHNSITYCFSSKNHKKTKYYRKQIEKLFSSSATHNLPAIQYSNEFEAEAVFSNYFSLINKNQLLK